MSRVSRTTWWLGGLGLALALVLLALAEPADVIALAGSARWPGLLTALALTGALALLRGARLAVLAGRRLRLPAAAAAAGVAQLATGVMPLRLGELAIVPLLRAAGLPGAVRALSLLLLARILDVLAVAAWATACVALAGGNPAAAAASLALVATLVAAGWLALTLGVRRAVRRWRRAAGVRRRALLQLLRVRRETRALFRSPARAGAAVALSVAVWGTIWAVTLVLLRAMGLTWRPLAVLLGVLGAAFGSALPVSSVGSFGTQEAGWAAALVGVGVAPRAALAAGFACHLWSVVLMLVVAGAGVLILAARRPDQPERSLLAVLRSSLRSARRP